VTLDQIVLRRDEGTSFRVSLARAADPGAPVVLVAPAMGMGARYYLPLVEALAASGVHGAVAEQRGHETEGGRVPGRDYDFGYAELLDDLTAAVAAVRAELPGAPLHLLGHSLGGQIATMYAALHPVDGLVLVASSTPYWRHWGPRLLAAGHGFPLVARMVGHFPGARVGFAGREARGVIRDWGRLARTDRFPIADDRVAAIEAPLLVISVEGDTLGVPRAIAGLADRMPRAAVTRAHLDEDGIDHMRWARQPESVVPLIGKWLGRQESPVHR
jgi:predicted alpha/beta hydrolase